MLITENVGNSLGKRTVFIYSICTMKCTLIKIRRKGVAFEQYEFEKQIPYSGELAIGDVLDDGGAHIIKMARFTHTHFGHKHVEVLFDPRIIWASEGRFTLRGVEREEMGGKVVEYSQSWLCEIAADRAAK